MVKTFEDFLMEKHAEQYVGTKDSMVDAFADWVTDLDCDTFVRYGDQFAKEQSKDLLEAGKELLDAMQRIGVSDSLAVWEGQMRTAIAKAEGGDKK